MKPGPLDLEIITGIAFRRRLTLRKTADSTPKDLTGWSVFAQARKLPDSPTAKVDLVPVIADAPNGIIEIGFSDENTDALPPGEYQWSLVLEMPSGDRVGPYLMGAFNITPGITRRTP